MSDSLTTYSVWILLLVYIASQAVFLMSENLKYLSETKLSPLIFPFLPGGIMKFYKNFIIFKAFEKKIG